MRIVRGAGKPDRLGANLNVCANAFNEYREIVGRGPDGRMLSELLLFHQAGIAKAIAWTRNCLSMPSADRHFK